MSELGCERMIPVPLNDVGRGELEVFTRSLETLENSESLSAGDYFIDRRQRSPKCALEASRHNLSK